MPKETHRWARRRVQNNSRSAVANEPWTAWEGDVHCLTPKRGLRLSVLATLMALVSWSSGAWAHGRFPSSGLVALAPSSDQRLVVRTTYGLVISVDAGESWRWICGEAPSYDPDTEDPAVLVDDSGRMALGAFDGLALSGDGCSWTFADGGLEGRYVVDLVTAGSGSGSFALSSNGVAADTFDVRLWRTPGGQDAWSLLHDFADDSLLGLTVGVSPSNPSRVYVSGRDGRTASEPDGEDSYAGVLLRSDDGGQSWTRLEVPGVDGVKILPYIAAVDPSDDARIYVAAISIPSAEPYFELLRSADGGETFDSIYQTSGGASAFALSPDGGRLALGGPTIGLLTANRDQPQFTQVNTARIGCINWHPTGMWLCTDEFVDGATLQRSSDEGVSLTPVMRLASPCGALECAENTTVAEQCVPRWPAEANELQAPASCEPGAGPVASSSCRLRAAAAAAGSEKRGRGDGVWIVLLAGAGIFAARRLRARGKSTPPAEA